jgi:TRAP-type uncharacterized transport system substrate-binding protein
MSGRVSLFSSIRNRFGHPFAQAATVTAFLISGAIAASAQTAPSFNPSRANTGTLGVISGGADGTYIRIAADLANVLDGEDLRVLPMIGRGSLQNLRDIMFLRGVDIGIVQMDAREQLKAEKLQDSAVRRLRFITRLYNEEVHIIASRQITDIRQLDGQKVNIDKAGSGTNLTSRLIFEKLGIKPEVTTFDSRPMDASIFCRFRSRARSPRATSRRALPAPTTHSSSRRPSPSRPWRSAACSPCSTGRKTPTATTA